MPGWRRFLDAVPQLHADHPADRRRRVARDRRVEHRRRAGPADGGQRHGRAAPGGQGRERDERAEVADEADRAGAPRRGRGRRSRPSRSSSATSCCSPPATTWRPTAGSSRRARSTSTSPRSPGRARRRRRRRRALADAEVGPGDQVNMAFMNTPVTHGSGVMLVTARGRRRPGRQDRRHAGDDRQGADAADQAAEHDDPVDRRGRAGDDDRDVRARAWRGVSPPTRCSSRRSRWRSRRSRRRCRPSCR